MASLLLSLCLARLVFAQPPDSVQLPSGLSAQTKNSYRSEKKCLARDRRRSGGTGERGEEEGEKQRRAARGEAAEREEEEEEEDEGLRKEGGQGKKKCINSEKRK